MTVLHLFMNAEAAVHKERGTGIARSLDDFRQPNAIRHALLDEFGAKAFMDGRNQTSADPDVPLGVGAHFRNVARVLINPKAANHGLSEFFLEFPCVVGGVAVQIENDS